MIQQILAIWSVFPLPFLNPIFTSGIFQIMYCWSLTWRILSITLLLCEMSAVVHSLNVLSHCLVWNWNEIWPFPVLWQLLSFPNLLAYWVQHFYSIISQIWNSSTGIPSPPLALFTVMLPKAHLTSPSRMSGSRWMIKSSWLTGSLRSFLKNIFNVFFPSLNLFCFCYVHTLSVFYCAHLWIKCTLGFSRCWQFDYKQMLAIWSLVPLPFLKTCISIWKFMVYILF